jgi:hypothetical protein
MLAERALSRKASASPRAATGAIASRDERQPSRGSSLGLVGREQLPREHDGALTFGELIGVLDTLAGERVVCVPDKTEASGGGLEVAGRLRRLAGARGHLFAVGDSAWLARAEGDFRSANLRTLDGNHFFVVKIELGANTMSWAMTGYSAPISLSPAAPGPTASGAVVSRDLRCGCR